MICSQFPSFQTLLFIIPVLSHVVCTVWFPSALISNDNKQRNQCSWMTNGMFKTNIVISCEEINATQKSELWNFAFRCWILLKDGRAPPYSVLCPAWLPSLHCYRRHSSPPTALTSQQSDAAGPGLPWSACSSLHPALTPAAGPGKHTRQIHTLGIRNKPDIAILKEQMLCESKSLPRSVSATLWQVSFAVKMGACAALHASWGSS